MKNDDTTLFAPSTIGSLDEADCLLFGAFAEDVCARAKRVRIDRASLAPLMFGGALPSSAPSVPLPPVGVAASSVAADRFALVAAEQGGLWQYHHDAAWSRVEVAGLARDERYASVAVGDLVCLALSAADGSVFQWRRRRRRGEDDEEEGDEGGDADDGGATCVLGPRMLDGDPPLYRLPVTAIAAGRQHQLAVSRAAAFAWGDTSRGQCGVSPGSSGHGSGSWLPRPRAIEALGGVVCALCAAGDAHSLLGSADGAAVYAFGAETGAVPTLVPDEDLPEEGAPVVALAAGGRHSVALRADGRVCGWGGAQWGEVAFGGVNGVRCIIAGWRHTVLVLHNTSKS